MVQGVDVGQEHRRHRRHRRGGDVSHRPQRLVGDGLPFDTTAEGRSLKLLNIVDEYTRECPAIVVDRSIDADKVVAAHGELPPSEFAKAWTT